MSIDINSPEFQFELEKTKKFADKVVKQFNWSYNPDQDNVERILLGLTNNKLIHGKRYCPCFVVTNTPEDRICPCKPAIEKEIPEDGICHCGIFCTPEFAEKKKEELAHKDEEVKTSQGFTKEEIEQILMKPQLMSEELEALLEARKLGMVDFKLVDVREPFEWANGRIDGADFLVPTSNFYEAIKQVEPYKDKPIIVYCHVGSRSAYVQRVLQQSGFDHVGNLTYGIASYRGKIVR